MTDVSEPQRVLILPMVKISSHVCVTDVAHGRPPSVDRLSDWPPDVPITFELSRASTSRTRPAASSQRRPAISKASRLLRQKLPAKTTSTSRTASSSAIVRRAPPARACAAWQNASNRNVSRSTMRKQWQRANCLHTLASSDSPVAATAIVMMVFLQTIRQGLPRV